MHHILACSLVVVFVVAMSLFGYADDHSDQDNTYLKTEPSKTTLMMMSDPSDGATMIIMGRRWRSGKGSGIFRFSINEPPASWNHGRVVSNLRDRYAMDDGTTMFLLLFFHVAYVP